MSSSTQQHSHDGHHPQNSVFRLIACTLGICVCYMYYGMVQESLFSQQKVGPSFVLLIQCITNSFVARIWQHLDQYFESDTLGNHPTHKLKTDNGASTRLHHPLMALTSLCYVSAMVCSNEALHYVSYPTAVLAKSCKLIPTMAMGVLVEKKKYQVLEWIAALCITLGIVIFNLSRLYQNQKSGIGEGEDSSLSGLVLLAASLFMDGFLGSCQGLLKQRKTISYKFLTGKDNVLPLRAPNAVETMLYINLYAILYLIPLTIINSQMQQGLEMLHVTAKKSFLEEGDDNAALALIKSLAAVAAGQIFIFLTITWYSSLVCTTITTTRKFFTILLSIVYFRHHFTPLQWFSTSLVFSGLYMGILGQRSKQQQQVETIQPQESKKTQ